MKNKIIGITGVARSGKDTFAKLIEKRFPDLKFKRLSLAKRLKEDLKDVVYDKYKLDVFSKKTEEKAIFRQLLVDYADEKRRQSEGQYFTSLLTDDVIKCMNKGVIPIICDIRFNTYDYDECQWLKGFGGILVHIEKLIKSDNGIISTLKPANFQEYVNDPKLKEVADAHVVWHEGLSCKMIMSKAYDQIAPAMIVIEEYLYGKKS